MQQESKIFLATLSLAMVCIIAISLNSVSARNDKSRNINYKSSVEMNKKLKIQEKNKDKSGFNENEKTYKD